MKVIKVKRLAYYNLITNDILWGGEEYDGNLTDKNILEALHEIGKTEWCPYCLGLYKLNSNGDITHRIVVETFYRYEKTWWDTFCDNIKRILRIQSAGLFFIRC